MSAMFYGHVRGAFMPLDDMISQYQKPFQTSSVLLCKVSSLIFFSCAFHT